MTLVLLTGFRYIDFSPRDDPNKRIRGYNVYLCAPGGRAEDGYLGVMPISDGGKRFISEALCVKLNLTRKTLDDCLYDFIVVNFDINGKFTEFRPLTKEEKQNNPDYPFGTDSGEEKKTKTNDKDYPF